MRVVIQRVSEASVEVNSQIIAKINYGLVIFLGIEINDETTDASWLVKKIIKQRIFSDDSLLMNHSLIDIKGEALVISQFTLHAKTKKGNRPSFIGASRPDHARPLYSYFIDEMKNELGNHNVKNGEFGADMKVRLLNDGPVTITMDSKKKE